MSKHTVTIRGLRVVTTCWSWAWSNRTSPSKWVGLGSPLAANSVYGDLTCSVHTVNNWCMFNCQCHFYLCNRGPHVRLAFVPYMLSSWNKDIIIITITLDLLNTSLTRASDQVTVPDKSIQTVKVNFQAKSFQIIHSIRDRWFIWTYQYIYNCWHTQSRFSCLSSSFKLDQFQIGNC